MKLVWQITRALTLALLLLAGPVLLPGSGLKPVLAKEHQQQYTCGMHPMIVVDEMGSCPICGMDLTPLKTDSAGGGTGSDQQIRIDSVTSQKMGIRTGQVTRRQLARSIRTVGLVDYQEPGQYAVNSKVNGWVEKLHVNQTGQQVAKGDALLSIYSPDLVAAQRELLLAIDNLAAQQESQFTGVRQEAAGLVKAARQRLRLWDINEQQITRLEKTRKVEKTLTLFAPTAGVVSKKQVREGEFINAGRELLEISDLSKIWVFADIYEYELPWLKTGLRARIKLPYAQEPIIGRISTIYPFLDAKTRTIKARIDLDNTELLLRPDMYVDVEIETDPTNAVLSIPSEAILYTGEQETVFVALGEGRYEPRVIQSGLLDRDGHIEIRSGLQEGETVVTSAQFMLDSESKLREALRKMRAPRTPETTNDGIDDLFDAETSEQELNELFK